MLVGNHLRPWLPLLVALSANSPFHHGRDTGYADWRAVIRSRFSRLGPPPYAESLRHQSELATAMAESEAMLDADTPYWDIRANSKFSTLEIRSMDVNADLDDTVALAILVRALVTTSTARVLAGDPAPRPCSELLRAAYWRAARDGWSGCGIDAMSAQIFRPHPGGSPLRTCQARPARLRGHRGSHRVSGAPHRARWRAERQRATASRHAALTAVVDELVTQTAAAPRESINSSIPAPIRASRRLGSARQHRLGEDVLRLPGNDDPQGRNLGAQADDDAPVARIAARTECATRPTRIRPWRQSGVTDSLSGFPSPCCLALLLLDVGQLLYSIGLRTFAFGLAALRLSVLQLGLCGCTGFLFCPDPA